MLQSRIQTKNKGVIGRSSGKKGVCGQVRQEILKNKGKIDFLVLPYTVQCILGDMQGRGGGGGLQTPKNPIF